MTEDQLPELPPPDVSGYPSLDDPDEQLSFSSDAMRAYGRECARVAMERAAVVCDSVESADTDWDTSYWNQAVFRCAAAIRALTGGR